MHKCSAEIKPQLVKEGQTTFNILYLEQKFHYWLPSKQLQSSSVSCHHWAFPGSLFSFGGPKRRSVNWIQSNLTDFKKGGTEPAAHFPIKPASPCIMQKLPNTKKARIACGIFNYFSETPLVCFARQNGKYYSSLLCKTTIWNQESKYLLAVKFRASLRSKSIFSCQTPSH